ncbi:MAG: hypothetical protein FWH29_03510 [Methanobrevibacter sp.]|nr:hypothetical protein [Methanobrevibacter sp.]
MKDKEKIDGNLFSRQSRAVKTIITLFGICCIGLIVLFALSSIIPDSMIPGNFSESKLYENEYLSFKYPQSLIDTTFFEGYDEERYIFYSRYDDTEPEHNGMTVYSEKIEESLVSTYLDSFYEDINSLDRDWVKNFTFEKIDFNGIPALTLTEEYYGSESVKYGKFLFLVHNDNFYTIYFCSDDFNNVEHMHELAKSSLILK